MTLLWLVILGAASIVLHDELGALTDLALTRPALVAGITLGSLLIVWLAAWALIARCGAHLDRKGSYRAIVRADRYAAWARGLGACIFVGAVQGLGWPSAVRSLVGNPVLFDEALAVAPLLALAAGLWYAIEPIESRTVNASMVRRLDSGEPLYPHAGRVAFVWMEVRHGILPSLMPALLLIGWTELLDRAGAAGPAPVRDWLATPAVDGAVRFAGAAAILLLVPVLQRRILPTTPFGPGPLRDAVRDLAARHGPAMHHLLIWRTGGRVAGACVIGLLPRVRAIVISDVLLESLSVREIEAVAAHEYGHVRHRHILWWSVALIAIVQWVRLAVGGAAAISGTNADESWGVVPASVLAIGAGLLAFGWVSRRFEWQADAFAAQHLSGHATRAGAADAQQRPAHVLPEATRAMSGALREVARLNGTPTSVFGWRHGSVDRRTANLEKLNGLPVDALPIDRTVRFIKAASVVLLVLGLAVRSAG
ncbi:MAG: M48 family metalloprotease [Phycisphaerales bacterium]|nr:M48 family metalloprotease [Phycisphaerales bacterium]